MSFVHLHVHSHYSLLDGLPKIDELIEETKKQKMKAVALTDHGVMYGIIEFYQKAKAAGIKPIIGVEAYIAPNGLLDKRPKIDEKPFHLVLLAKNDEGYKNLIKLTSIAHLQGFYYKPRLDKEILKQHSRGIIALSACLQGEIPRLIINNQTKKAEEILQEYKKIFGENFYLEIQDHPNLREQKIVNKAIFQLAKKYKIPLVATNDVHYLKEEDAEIQDILLCVQTKKKKDDPDRLSMLIDDFSFRSEEKMKDSFKDYPEAISNTEKIADQCNVEIKFGENKLPFFPLPAGEDANQYLRELCEKNIIKRYGKETKKVSERLEKELLVIKKTGFAGYFLIVQDFVNWSKKNNIVVGPGRGSAAGSIVSYLLNITNIDPLKYELLFERFLNEDRSMPDIDLDFTDKRRDEVIQYIEKKYGHDHVSQIITFGTMASRAAVRDVGRVLDCPYMFCDKLAKAIPLGFTLDKALRHSQDLKEIYSKEPQAQEIIRIAQKLEGVIRHASKHACGLLITPLPLTEYVPVQYDTSGQEKIIISEYDMYAVENLGLLKMDLLGLKNLTIIEKTLDIVEHIHNKKIDIDNIPLDDKKVFQLLQKAQTQGVFQLECLSGDTIVSNTTIKKLFEQKNKKVLQSVYLDEGKIHENKIKNILYKGEKKIYTLITENNRYIKATLNHSFLTENGWKKLKNIKTEDKVLMKEKAKYLIYNTCKNCGKQISGNALKKSNFCYHCSASFYKNPSKPSSRKRISEAKIKFYENGGKPWNHGMTTENNELWAKTAKKISKALTGTTLEDRYGKKQAKEIKKKMSIRSKGENNPMFGKPPHHRKGGFREDLGHYVRSAWEADFARILKLYNLKYEYEPKTFKLKLSNGEICHYTPDFYVKSNNTFYEVKGWMHDIDKEKIDAFQKEYIQYNFVLINNTKFAELALQYKDLIRWECPRIPVKNSFKFIKVKKILPCDKAKTYDITMESPGNNFVANSFVVHNSSGMQKYLKKLKPNCFEDIIAMVALYRPGPIELIPDYIDRKQGLKEIKYLHPKLKPILEKTYGIAVYQEQILQIVRDLANFSLSEADVLRKAVGKKIAKLLQKQKEKFIDGCIKNKISKEIAQKVFTFIEPFAQYGFNRSHAACYATIAYQTAYLKAHYATEFVAALLCSDQNNIDKITIEIKSAKEMGIEILPPDINESFKDFTVVGKNKIRFGLLAIKNVGKGISETIITERKNDGNFQSLEDFLARIQSKDLNKKSLESLIKSGALDHIEERNQMLENIETLLDFTRKKQKDKENGQTTLFTGIHNTNKTDGLTLKKSNPAKRQQKLIWERELLGLFVSEHPLKEYEEILKKYAKPIGEVGSQRYQTQIKIVGIITKIKKILTSNKEIMAFIKIEDPSGEIEIIVFPKTFKTNAEILEENKTISVTGKISRKDESLKIIVEKVREVKKELLDNLLLKKR